MLAELYVKNLAVIGELRLELNPGLTILSGEEGVGKSLLADALCLLTGGRAATSLIRTGASAAVVEGVFWAAADDADLEQALQEAGIDLEGDGSLILAREVRENGRSVARVNGRAVPVSTLQELGCLLMDINSQIEHVSLPNPQRQLDLLDGYAGLLERRSCLAGKLEALREKDRELSTVSGKGVERRRELLEFQVAEIEGAQICPGEDETLEQEKQVLQRARSIKEGCHRVCSSLYSDDLSAASLVHQAAQVLQGIVAIDPGLGSHLEALECAFTQLEETARDVRCYAEAVESRSGRLQEVEKRLEFLRHLKSKYGLSLQDVIDFADAAREELEVLTAQKERQSYLIEERQVMEGEVSKLADELSGARQEAARSLTELVNRELSDLGMPQARFDIILRREESPDGLPLSDGAYVCSKGGIDRVEFLGVTNPGEPLRPLAEIASGGETCRFMLGVRSALKRNDPVPTLVFDEIDAGIGGRNAQVVGRKLASLANSRQVICITHLPHIACFGHDHFRVIKEVFSGRAATRVEHLEGWSRIEELAAMLGSSEEGSMVASAEELLRQAARCEGEYMEAIVS